MINRPEPGGLIDRALNAVRALRGQKSYYNPAPWDLGNIVWSTPGTNFDYKARAGDVDTNAAVMAVVNWICRTVTEAPLRVQRYTADGTTNVVHDHALTKLLKRPNPYYSGIVLRKATLRDFNLTGNSYWLKARNPGGRVVELWFEPSFSIRVGESTDNQEFIPFYEIYRGGRWLRVEREDVVHFRAGLDPKRQRYGPDPLMPLLREIATDNEAANYAATLLMNMGIPGLIISPDGDGEIKDPDALKAAAEARFTGDNRGRFMVFTKRMKIERLAFTPTEINTRELRRVPEERISGGLGIPAVVAGLGAGLDRAIFNNVREAREQAYEENIIPNNVLIATDLDTQLLVDLGNPDTEFVSFDYSQVRALQEDQDNLYKRAAIGWNAGYLKRSEARQMTGWAVAPEDDTFKSGNAPMPDTPAPETEPVKRYFAGAAVRKALPSAPDDELVPVYSNGNGAHEEGGE